MTLTGMCRQGRHCLEERRRCCTNAWKKQCRFCKPLHSRLIVGTDHAESACDAWRQSGAELGIAAVSLARMELQMDWSLTTPTASGGSAAQRVRHGHLPVATHVAVHVCMKP